MTCNAYIDSQYNQLQCALYEAEIEQQTAVFTSLKEQYDAFINEGTVLTEAEKLKIDPTKIKAAIKRFFTNIANFMTRWITKILVHSNRFKGKCFDVFEAHRETKDFVAPEFDVKEAVADTTAALNKFEKSIKDVDFDSRAEVYDDLIKAIDDKMKKYEVTDFVNERKQLVSYKGSISSIKSHGDSIVKSLNICDNTRFGWVLRFQLRFVKKIIKCIQARATYAAKLILKAAKMAKKTDSTISDKDLAAMSEDIEYARDKFNNALDKANLKIDFNLGY